MTRSMTCACQLELTAADTETLVGPVKAHFDEAHPDLGLTETSVRNYLEGEDRGTGPTERLERVGEIEIRPIRPDRVDDVARFFDYEVFAGNPAWSSCYCMFYFRGGGANPDWGDQTWQDNRADQMNRIVRGRTTGTLAYVDGRLAGWCNATARDQFPGLSDGTDEGIASVVCFAIAPPYRRHGLATRLLEGAIDMLTEQGFRRVEAYPVREPSSELAAYHGSLELFERLGFEITSEEPLTVGLELQ